jgi:hypothetical protein
MVTVAAMIDSITLHENIWSACPRTWGKYLELSNELALIDISHPRLFHAMNGH